VAFSALVNALEEADSLAIVRYVGKSFTRNDQQRWPDPKMCALWPVVGADGLEYAYLCQVSTLTRHSPPDSLLISSWLWAGPVR